MAVDVQTEIEIDCDAASVSKFAANPDNAPKWYANIKSVEWVTERPFVVQSQIAFVANFLGRRLAYTYEMVEYEDEKRLVMRTSDGPFPMETTYEWEALGKTKTRMRLRNRGQPKGWSRVSAPLMAAAMRRANVKDLAALKVLMEAKPDA